MMLELAQQKDAQAILNVVTLSIEACTLDHQNDPDIIQSWLSNKTLENMKLWIEKSYSFTYKKNGNIIGFILLSKEGNLLLNYVLPDQQGMGIGSALINHIIGICKSNNIEKIKLESTLTAKNFYLSNNFKIIEEIYENNNLVAYRMERIIK